MGSILGSTACPNRGAGARPSPRTPEGHDPRRPVLAPASIARPKFPLPQEGMALISLAKASLGARVFWLQGEGDSEQIEGALL